MSQINTTVVAQSAMGLVIAITIADTIRECFTIMRPHHPFAAIIARLVLVVLVLIGAFMYYEWHSQYARTATTTAVSLPQLHTLPLHPIK